MEHYASDMATTGSPAAKILIVDRMYSLYRQINEQKINTLLKEI